MAARSRERIRPLEAFTGSLADDAMPIPQFWDETRNDLNNQRAGLAEHGAALGDLQTRLGAVEPQIKALDNWKTKMVDPAMTNAANNIRTLYADKVSAKTYDADQIETNDTIASVKSKLAELSGTSSTFSTKFSSTDGRLERLESRARDLEGRVSGHEGKFLAYEEEFDRVREDIKHGNHTLGNRIDEQGRLLDKQGRKIDQGIEYLAGLINGPGDALTFPNFSPGPRNRRYPGSANVVKCGGSVSFQTPDCNCYDESSVCEGGNPGALLKLCGCQSCPSRCATPRSKLQRRTSCEPGCSPRRVHEDFSDSASGNSNYNYAPDILVEVVKEGGGGLFGGKAKKGSVSMAVGGGGGGGASSKRRHRARNYWDGY